MKFHKPMLAKTFESYADRLEFPCYVQPKLDGIRCLTDGQRFWSRNGKLFPIINLKHLQIPVLPHLVDGELFIEDATFEDIVSAVKHASDDDRTMSKRLRFNVFDILTPKPYYLRKKQVESIVKFAGLYGAKWKNVLTQFVASRSELNHFASNMLKLGREGTIVRSANGLYVPRRTHDVLKYKPLLDAEFEIIAIKQAKGKDEGTPIFICRVGLRKFAARPMGTMKQRRQMWRDRKSLIGCKVTVEYQNLTKYGVPRFPRAKVLRDYE